MKNTCPEKSCFLLHRVYRLCPYRLCTLGLDGTRQGCTVARRQASGGGVMLWEITSWEAQSSDIYMDVNLVAVV
ncbi:hypothetical protein GJAV_G00081650 [Gymnothorax javanicus]|nr:hypothetical protein GJAV_G00081650 [Gymnothorax javanicus]